MRSSSGRRSNWRRTSGSGGSNGKKMPGVTEDARRRELVIRSEVRIASVEESRESYANRPPCPRQATSQPVTWYRARSGGSIRSTTLGLADRKQPGAEITGTSYLYDSRSRLPG